MTSLRGGQAAIYFKREISCVPLADVNIEVLFLKVSFSVNLIFLCAAHRPFGSSI